MWSSPRYLNHFSSRNSTLLRGKLHNLTRSCAMKWCQRCVVHKREQAFLALPYTAQSLLGAHCCAVIKPAAAILYTAQPLLGAHCCAVVKPAATILTAHTSVVRHFTHESGPLSSSLGSDLPPITKLVTGHTTWCFLFRPQKVGGSKHLLLALFTIQLSNIK